MPTRNKKPIVETTEPYSTGPDAARFLRVDPATIRRWRKAGAPCHILGVGLVRYRISELLAWRSQHYAN
jgi:Helix-turn-helix domain